MAAQSMHKAVIVARCWFSETRTRGRPTRRSPARSSWRGDRMGLMQSTISDAMLGAQQLGERTLSSLERSIPQRDTLDRPPATRDELAPPATDGEAAQAAPARDVVQRVRELLAACPERPPEMD